MSGIALKTVRDWYRTGNPELLATEIEWQVLESFPSGGLYRGREAVLHHFFPALKAHFAAYETRPETFLADGETVVATGRYHVRGRSGTAAAADFAHVWTVRAGVIVAFRQIADTAVIAAATA